jgi:hypothetical protein
MGKKYDDASWHYEGDYPQNLPNANAAIHIGMFITWCIENDLIDDENDHIEDCAEEIQKIKKHEMTGGQFLIECCDEKFIDYDLSDLGNAFAEDYYDYDTEYTIKYGDDFCDLFDEYETAYHVEDTWENYKLIKKIIDKRFEEWKKYKNTTIKK